ncbi:FAD-dependent oxidoreductase [Caulobacter sp. UNC358MFTsu5.1]|uniref:FAD-dependent oxidoreductase n=1 Tax=Caulobacter sp. UNC358MFTsu5.1 TaxID=1449049 RepID=UPI0004A6BC10|nr:GMC family oxidoreductase [Caulobacter sp. UNC358MFTsu5.1]
MIRNGKDIANGETVSTQVCIIGSGPAGITTAWFLQKAGLKVTLIEGSRVYPGYTASQADKALLYDGLADGLFTSNEREFLILRYPGVRGGPSERERFFGGTSTHWGGQSRPLDAVSFEKRPGFPGWPITRADLDPFYSKAAAFCDLHDDFTAEYWAKVLHADVPKLPGFEVAMYQFMPGTNFATRTFEGQGTIGQSACDVILNASLLEIDHAGGQVNGLRVASMDDSNPVPKKATEFTVKADVYVLACGAVENARLLLLSDAGNETGQVGKTFMCHPLSGNVIGVSGSYLTYDQQRLMDGVGMAGARAATFNDANGVGVTGRFQPDAEQQRKLGIGSCWFWWNGGQYYYEMAPNPGSQIALATDPKYRDKVFGQPQTHITWKLDPRDQVTYEKTTALFQASVAGLGGRVTFPDWAAITRQVVVNGHHIGTARMSALPADGVVDADLKVHTLDNLYVSGASAFPSAGISNPTFTIITLAIRLAEHLIGKLKPH